MKIERNGSANPYGKAGDVTTKQIIDRALKADKAMKTLDNGEKKKGQSEKTIGEMTDEILKEVHTRAEFIDFRK